MIYHRCFAWVSTLVPVFPARVWQDYSHWWSLNWGDLSYRCQATVDGRQMGTLRAQWITCDKEPLQPEVCHPRTLYENSLHMKCSLEITIYASGEEQNGIKCCLYLFQNKTNAKAKFRMHYITLLLLPQVHSIRTMPTCNKIHWFQQKFHISRGLILLTWFNFNPSMDK